MKEHKTDYNLLDLIENSSRNRQSGAAAAGGDGKDTSPQGQNVRKATAQQPSAPAPDADSDVRIYRGGRSEAEADPLENEGLGRNSIRFNVIDDEDLDRADDLEPVYDGPDRRQGDSRADGDYDGDAGRERDYYEPTDRGAEQTEESDDGSFFAGVGNWFRTFPARTADFFRNFPERMSQGWEKFKPEWRLFWKHASWKKVLDRAFLLLLFPLCFFIRNFVSQYPAEVESFYSDGLNYVIRMVLNVASTLTSVPVFDVICWIAIIIAAALFVLMIVKIAHEKKWHRKWYVVCGFASGAAVFLAIMFFVYQLNFGLNDYRMSLDSIMRLPVKPAGTEELTDVCKDLVFRADEVRKYLNEDEKGAVKLPDRDAVLVSADNGFSAGTRYFGELTFLPSMSLGKQSFDMSVAKFTGFSFSMTRKGKTYSYQPFTGEVLVNKDVSDYMLPATVCQGLAAQMGFSDPEACDFLSFLAAVNHSDPYYNYSGLMLGLDRCMARLRTMSPAAYNEVRQKFSAEMERDIAAAEKLGWFAEPQVDREGVEIPVDDTLTTGLILSYYSEGYMKDVQIGVHTGETSEQTDTGDAQETTDALPTQEPTAPPENTH